MSRVSVPCRSCRLVLVRINESGALTIAPGVTKDAERESGAWWLTCPACGQERRFELRSQWVKAVA